jgi:hypothetical protein
VFRALDPGHIGSKIAMVLKKVQMPPGEFPEVMSLALFCAHGTGIPGTPVSTDSNMELMRRFVGFKMLINNLPWFFQTKAKGHYIFGKHKQILLFGSLEIC